MTNDLELWKDPTDNTYILEINTCLSEGDNILEGVDYTPYSRDILIYMCSVVSSNPNDLFDMLYSDSQGTKVFIDSSWTTVGDCQVLWDSSDYYENHLVYKIKKAK